MQMKYWKSLAVLALMAFGMSSAEGASRSDDDRQSEGLVGSWVFQVSLQDCVSGSPIGSPFLSLLTFNRGGTVTETTSNPSFVPPTERGPGHGIWRHSEHGNYEATTTAFITVNGTLARTQTITQTIELDGEDSLKTTTASVKFYSPTGSLLMSGCAAATGKRIEF